MATIDVLIVTALKEEHDAARDVALATPGLGVAVWEKRDIKTPTPYLLGKYVTTDGRSLTVALARPTRVGGTATAPVAASLVERLKPRCLAMCGVCAGNPADLALGDVIIAEMVYIYDEGKRSRSKFEADHRQTPMPDTWLYAAQDLTADGLPSYGAASDEEAELWLLERVHVGDDPRRHPARARYFPENTLTMRVRALEVKGLVLRSGAQLALTSDGRAAVDSHHDQAPAKLPFQIKVGPIASGNAVVKDGLTWDRLKKWGVRSVLGLEMEAATIGSIAQRLAVPNWLVAKGVMDHADPRKDDRYKQFAARASAEVLFKFLSAQLAPSEAEPRQSNFTSERPLCVIENQSTSAAEASGDGFKSEALRILYCQTRPRSDGLDCINSTRLVDELRRRGHELRLCWAVHEQLKDDPNGANPDLVSPHLIRQWRPQALVFEEDFVMGPRIPPLLLDELEGAGTVAIIELSAAGIWGAFTNRQDDMRLRYEDFLASRNLRLYLADHPDDHHPTCRSKSSAYIETSVDELRLRSCLQDEYLFHNVRKIGVGAAAPLQSVRGVLVTGGDGVYVKAYGSRCHYEEHPPYGALYDRRGRTEAIFTGHIIRDYDGQGASFDNHHYLANLLEVLHFRRSQTLNTGW